MNKMNKLLILTTFLITLICITSTLNTNALTYEGSTGVDAGGLSTYMAWFNDRSGVLFVTTNFVNNSGLETADITVFAGCMDSDRVIRLRIYDSDLDEYFNPHNEDGVGSKTRKFSVNPHMDAYELEWRAEVTAPEGGEILAEIVMIYYYDPEAIYEPVVDDANVIGLEEYEREKFQWTAKAYTWVAQAMVGSIIGIFIGIKLTNRIWGSA